MRSSCDHLAENTVGAVTSGSPSGRGAVWDAIHAAWAEEDARLRAWLDVAAKALGRCRYCQAHLREGRHARTSGACSKKQCKRLAKRFKRRANQARE